MRTNGEFSFKKSQSAFFHNDFIVIFIMTSLWYAIISNWISAMDTEINMKSSWKNTDWLFLKERVCQCFFFLFILELTGYRIRSWIIDESYIHWRERRCSCKIRTAIQLTRKRKYWIVSRQECKCNRLISAE